MMIRRILLATLLILSPFTAAGAQGTPEQRILAARRQAEQAGIPVELLNTKVDEGRAKGVPMDRIAMAVERRLASIARARDAMGGPRAGLSPQDLSVGADALDVGVAPAALRQLSAAAPADRRAIAIAALTQLVQGGASSERALQQVSAALAGGAEALRRLPGEANGAASGQRRGPPPGRGPGEAGGRGNGRGRGGGGGPPASVPGPKKEKPDRGNNGGGNGNKP
jgi:hypothetical protein